MTERQLTFQVTDLRQYLYCPRVVFYTYCLPLIRPTTFKMEEGLRSHREEAERERRRGLRVYGLPEGERITRVDLASGRLGLRGRVDLVIRVENREAIPVEYKNSVRVPGEHFQLQLATYGLMLEEKWGLPVRRGFIYAIPLRRAREVPFSPAMFKKVEDAAIAMWEMVEGEQMPEPPARRRQCVACEFRRFCNDM